jgi:alkanesulfonate monooxygenase SsuD/methylene tetrahydromethanopterin reductase-like flavin-dependent oxidoreductase (luciferase family)
MVAALPRCRPWKVAREVATLDHLSSGRVTWGVGLGFQVEGMKRRLESASSHSYYFLT